MRRIRLIAIPLTNVHREVIYDSQNRPCVADYGKLVPLTETQLRYPCYWTEVKRGRDPLHYSENGMPAEGQMEITEVQS